MKPIDVYVRVSRVGGREGVSFQSPDQQEERCRAQLKADGLKAGRIFVDLDESGATASRPAFDEVLARIESGISGGVIVYDLSRFGRNTRNVLDGIDFIEAHEAVFISCAEKFDTSTATGRFVLTLLAALRELEREQSRERWEISKAKARARGVHIGAARAGYRRNGKGELVEVPEHIEAVKAAFALRTRGGSWKETGDLLTEARVPTSKGAARWSRQATRNLISNRAYRGNPIPAWQWDEAQPKKGEARVRGEGHVLGQGLVRCATCGEGLHRSSNGKRYPILRCETPGHGHPTISYERAADYLITSTVEHLGLLLSQLHLGDDGAEIEAAEARLAQARADLAELEVAREELSPLAFGRALDKARTAVEEAEDALAALDRAQGWWMQPFLLTIGGGNRLAFDALSVPDKRRFLHEQIERVILKPGRGAAEDRLEIEWKREAGHPEIAGEGWTVLEFSEQVALAFQDVEDDAPITSETLDALREQAAAELRRGGGLHRGATAISQRALKKPGAQE